MQPFNDDKNVVTYCPNPPSFSLTPAEKKHWSFGNLIFFMVHQDSSLQPGALGLARTVRRTTGWPTRSPSANHPLSRAQHMPRATHSPHPGPGKHAASAAPPSSRTRQRCRCCNNLRTAAPGRRCFPVNHPDREEGGEQETGKEQRWSGQFTWEKPHAI